MGKRRIATLRANIVRVQCVSRAAVEKPTMSGVTQQEQVIIAFDVRTPTPKMRPDTTLRVFVRISPKLAGHKNPMAGVELLMNTARDMLAECMENGIATHVVRVTNVVNL